MIRYARSAIPLVVLALAAGCGGSTGDGEGAGAQTGAADTGAAATSTTGRLVIVGGALEDDNAEVYQAIVDARDGDGPICVVPTASGVPETSMTSAVKAFDAYVGDGGALGILLSEQNADEARDPRMAALLDGCSGYFFTGGDQARVVDTFLPGGDTTVAFRAVRRRFEEGAVVSGSSAGAAMMSGVMIASGSSAGAIEHGITYGAGPDLEEGGERIRRGMGFFERAILDQHFLSRGRVGRLVVATLATDSLPVGLGIDENTALVVDGDQARVVGASGAVVVDARNATRAEGAEDGAGAVRFGTGVRITLAGTGDAIDLTTFQVIRGAGKSVLQRTAAAFEPPADPFARWAFLHLLADLARSPASSTDFAVAGATLSLRKGDAFSAAALEDEGVQGEPRGLSAGPFVVDLVAAGSR